MKFAIVKTGGKQYKVAPQDVIRVEKLEGKAGDTIELTQVLMTGDDESESLEVGKPTLENKKVLAKILEQGKADKVTVIKYKPKTRYRRKQGHRQFYTKLQIESI